MNRFLVLILFIPFLLYAEEEIVVRLPTGIQLVPISVSFFEDDNSGFEKEYIEKLEEVLRFDFNHNGMTVITDEGLYVIKVRMSEHKLFAEVLSDDGELDKGIDEIVLTGYLGDDRQIIHKLADTIHEELFGVEGIAASRFLYTLRHGESSEVWEADYDGENARQVTQDGGYCVTPCYIPPKPGHVPGGFFYVAYKTGQPKIYVAPLKDGVGQRFSNLGGVQLMPALSRQRDLVAFISDVSGNPDLFMQAFDPEEGPQGKPRQILTAKFATQGTPTFSPDGTRIAFVSNKDGSPRIYIIKIPDPETLLKEIKTELVTKFNRESTAPAWSPDGTKIAYCAKTKGIRQIWVYDLLKKRETQLTQGPGNKENPTWAPNSLHIIFNSTDADNSELYLLNLKQPKTIKISSGPGKKRFPSFAPRSL